MKQKDTIIFMLEEEVKRFNDWYDIELYIEEYGGPKVGEFLIDLLINYIERCVYDDLLWGKPDLDFFIGYEYRDCFVWDREKQHYVICFGGRDMIKKQFLKQHRHVYANALRVIRKFKDKEFTADTPMENLIEAQ